MKHLSTRQVNSVALAFATLAGAVGAAAHAQIRQNDGFKNPSGSMILTNGSDSVDGSAGDPHGVSLALVGPPPPTEATDTGACCTGSSCTNTDAIDCRAQSGYFLAGVECADSTCAAGVCCTEGPACVDDDGAGGVDEAACSRIGGTYVGGALCGSTDPCQPHRIPPGFEIVDVFSWDMKAPRRPELNNCGQIVFSRDVGPLYETNEIFLYDNGSIEQITDNAVYDYFPDINDAGAIVWSRGGSIMLREHGQVTRLGGGQFPIINNLGHVVWSYFYDGYTTRRLTGPESAWVYADGMNDEDEIVWTRSVFPWDASEIVLYSRGIISVLPSASDLARGADLNNQSQVVWDAEGVGIELWENGETSVVSDYWRTSSPVINNAVDIAYKIIPPTGRSYWLKLVRDGQTFTISNDQDITDGIDNGSADINDLGELVWRWHPNANLRPGGISLMRRIRNGDADFDGTVDLDDFISLARCFTGPLSTDGLCECRFLDIDHDRDVDHDDFDLFMRSYTGPADDCNDTLTMDLRDILDGASEDCNENGTPDECDVAAATSPDDNGDGVPDECQPDCNSNGTADGEDIVSGTSEDCDENGIPDECEPDCNANGIADECEIDGSDVQIDCNNNVIPDECDIESGTSEDCNGNGTPDECMLHEDDCNHNAVPDGCDIAWGTSEDCNGNGNPDDCIGREDDCNGNLVPDACDIADGTSQDCAGEGVPDDCEPDCNINGAADSCDIYQGTSDDCNENSVPDDCEPDCNGNTVADSCDIAGGGSQDLNGNGEPDECETGLLGDKIYWATNDLGRTATGAILRADLDGTHIEVVLTGLDYPMDIALDLGGGKMYWSDNGANTVSRANLDGSDREELFSTSVYGIGLDLTAEKLYWANWSSYSINRVNLDGSGYERFLQLEDAIPTSLFVDDVAGKLYWAHLLYQPDIVQIHRTDLDGTGVELLFEPPSRGASPWYLDLDSAAAKLYYTQVRFVQRANLDGTNEETIRNTTSPYRASGIGVDSGRGKVYWTEYAWGKCDPNWARPSKIYRANLDGTQVEEIVSMAGCFTGLALDLSRNCNANVLPDDVDIASGVSRDCNANLIPDECDIADGTSEDRFFSGGDGIPDECQMQVTIGEKK